MRKRIKQSWREFITSEFGTVVSQAWSSLKEHYFISLVVGGIFYGLLLALSFVGEESFLKYSTSLKNLLVEQKEIFTSFFLALVIFTQKYYLRIRRLKALGKVAIASGIYFYSPNKSYEHNQEADNFLNSNASNNVTIKILGASGYKTFASPLSPMHNAVKTAETVECILMHPESPSILQRVKDLHGGATLEEQEERVKVYKNEIRQSIEFLQGLSCESKRISLKLYSRYPIWKLIILDHYAYVQLYHKEYHVQDCPAAAYQRLDDKSGLFSSYRIQFDRIWESPRLYIYDFKTKILPPLRKKGKA